MVQPGLVRGPAMLGLDGLGRQVVEGPHALFGLQGGGGQAEGQQGQDQGAGIHGSSRGVECTNHRITKYRGPSFMTSRAV